MAHYAFIDDQGIVVEVITGRDETDTVDGISDWETYYQSKRENVSCKRTSYNTWAGQHLTGGMPFRKNFAGIGFSYDAARDAFIPPKPFDSWILDESTCHWQPPVARPVGNYAWDEATLSWVELV